MWKQWKVLISLGRIDEYRNDKDKLRSLGTIKARTESEAETKALRLVKRYGLSGLTCVQETNP